MTMLGSPHISIQLTPLILQDIVAAEDGFLQVSQIGFRITLIFWALSYLTFDDFNSYSFHMLDVGEQRFDVKRNKLVLVFEQGWI